MHAARDHWEAIWSKRTPNEVSWYQPEARHSFDLVTELAPAETPIVDVGGGASTLVDGLLDAGYRDLTVLDISAAALEHARQRIGARSAEVTWIDANVLEHRFTTGFGVWHDRATFHFLIDPSDRSRYTATAHTALEPGGHLIVATFGLEAPPSCSGLPVERFDAQRLTGAFDDGFEPVRFDTDHHETPSGATQQFTYGVFRRV